MLSVVSANDLEVFATNGVEDFHLTVVNESPGRDTSLGALTQGGKDLHVIELSKEHKNTQPVITGQGVVFSREDK